MTRGHSGRRRCVRLAAAVIALTACVVSAWASGGGNELHAPPPPDLASAAGTSSTQLRIGVPYVSVARGLLGPSRGIGATPDGFAVQVTKEALRAVGLEAVFVPLPPGADLISELNRAKKRTDPNWLDAVVPLSISEERINEVDFSVPLVTARGAVVTRANMPEIDDIDGLRGKRVIVAKKGAGQLWCVERGVECVAVDTLQQALRMLTSGQADYLVTLQMAARWEAEVRHVTGLVKDVSLRGPEHLVSFALAGHAGDERLSNAFNRGLSVLRDSGRYDQLYEEWVQKYQPVERPPMVRQLWLNLVAGLALALLAVAAVWQVVMYRRLVKGTRVLRESEAALRQITEALDQVVWLYDLRSEKQVFMSPAFERVYGLPVEAMAADPTCWRKVVHPDDLEMASIAVEKGNADPAGCDVQYRVVKRDGSVRWIHDRAVPLIGPDGDLEYVAGIAQDVTELREAQETLRGRESYYRGLFESSNDAFMIFEPEGERILSVNERACAMYGYTPEELTRMSMENLSTDVGRGRARIEATVAAGKHDEFITQHVRRDGTLIDVEIRAAVIEHGGRRVILSVNRDVTERRQAQERLEESEARSRMMLDNVDVVVWEGEPETFRFTYVNGRAEALTGFTVAEWLEPGFWAAQLHPEDRDWALSYCAASTALGEPHQFEYRLVAKDGRVLWLRDIVSVERREARPTRVRGVMVDITAMKRAEEEQKRLDEQLMQAQKLESLGVLVGGVAHDFNNLLAGVLGNAGVAIRGLAPDDPARRNLEQIQAAAARAADLTRNMLAYAGEGQITPRPADLRALVRETLTLVSGSIARSATVRVKTDEPLLLVECDAAQVSQVVMNLVLNASDALGSKSGTIQIRTGVGVPGEEDLRRAFPAGWAGGGEMVFLEVSDTGCGMAQELVPRIFDPFFTTKFAGRGLGLAAVLGIVRGHGGAISVTSEPEAGSTFRVWFPAIAGTLGQTVEMPGPMPTAATAAQGQTLGTVLVVDDERMVLDMVAAVLESAGFAVIKASGGAEALRLLSTAGTEGTGRSIDGVLLDLTMPEMDGEQVLKAMRVASPKTPVVLMSGYGERQVLERLAGVEVKSFLAKPFRVEDLIATARGMVEGKTTGAGCGGGGSSVKMAEGGVESSSGHGGGSTESREANPGEVSLGGVLPGTTVMVEVSPAMMAVTEPKKAGAPGTAETKPAPEVWF